MLIWLMEVMYIFGRNVKYIVIMGSNMEFFLKFKIELFYDLVSFCLGLCLKNIKLD